MINKNFYPTPSWLVEKMISKIDTNKISTILEPSAGKGNILSVIKHHSELRNISIDCIEIEQDLRSILKDNGYTVVYDDFIKYHTYKKYDLIIMNPPFDNGDKHLLKAISMVEKYGGQIVCLLNAETIKNPYSVYRVDLLNKLEKYKANIEIIQNAFSNAERKTEVEIALIYINIDKVETESIILNSLEKAKELEIDKDDFKEVVHTDFIKKIVDQYNYEITAGINLIQEYNKISKLTKSSFDDKYSYNVLELTVSRDSRNLINNFIEKIRYKYWSTLFNSKDFNKHFTTEMQEFLNSKISCLKNYEFNEFNILEIKNEMMNNLTNSIEEAIIKLFDKLSHIHSYGEEYSKNIHYYNGWKTNNAYKINKKVIIPLKSIDWWDKKFEYSHKVFSTLYDIEKVLNYLNNKEIESIDLERVLQENLKNQKSKDIECKYFKVTFYKKGTCHITFKDDDLLLKFNIFGSQKKGWLPHDYGKKAYENMCQEEKDVINSFQGAKEYEKVLDSNDIYLINKNNFLAIEM